MLFYSNSIEENAAAFAEDESFHCIRVLRLKTGDPVLFTDGKGNLYQGRITNPSVKKCMASIEKITRYGQENKLRVHIAIAPTKNIDRFEFFLEKATEIGVDIITPIVCSRSERKTVNQERLNKILVSAMKQSERYYLPVLNSIINFSEFIDLANNDQGFICIQSADHPLKEMVAQNKKRDICILIGPEGDFTESEMKESLNKNYLPVTLGNHRLRTETAGIVACTICNLES